MVANVITKMTAAAPENHSRSSTGTIVVSAEVSMPLGP